MNNTPITIEGPSISLVWIEAMRALLQSGVERIIPLMVSIDLTSELPVSEPAIERVLDENLEKRERNTCQTTANTIFPLSLWNRSKERSQLFIRYQQMLPKLRQIHANRYGTYFGRLIYYEDRKDQACKPINQLEHIIRAYLQSNGRIRRSALQAAIFNPAIDHTTQPRRGFPCLQHVFFTPIDGKYLTITGVYATQYIFDRAYGNYLGLYNLGQFMATEMKLRLSHVICVASQAELGEITKYDGRMLVDEIENTSVFH